MLFDDDNALDVEGLLILMATVTWSFAATLVCGVTLLALRLVPIWLG